jgi:hypothetical protein
MPKGSVIHSYILFGGQDELSLAGTERLIVAHTTKYMIYEFWNCVLSDPDRMAQIAKHMFPQIRNVNMFAMLQDSWAEAKDPYVRAALFFLMNRCSTKGLISSGELDEKNFHPLSLSYLKNFKIPNFHLCWDNHQEFTDSITEIKEADYLLFPAGRFAYNLFEDGKSKGHETTTIYHKKLYEALQKIKKKWIVIYKHHPQVHLLYSGQNIMMLDKYGRETRQKETCEDLIIANF